MSSSSQFRHVRNLLMVLAVLFTTLSMSPHQLSWYCSWHLAASMLAAVLLLQAGLTAVTKHSGRAAQLAA